MDWVIGHARMKATKSKKQGTLILSLQIIKSQSYMLCHLDSWMTKGREMIPGNFGRKKTWRRTWEMLDLIWSRASRKANSKWFHYSTHCRQEIFIFMSFRGRFSFFVVSLQAKESAHLKEKSARENKDLDQNCSWFFFHIMSHHGPLDHFLEPSSLIWLRISPIRNWWLGIKMR